MAEDFDLCLNNMDNQRHSRRNRFPGHIAHTVQNLLLFTRHEGLESASLSQLVFAAVAENRVEPIFKILIEIEGVQIEVGLEKSVLAGILSILPVSHIVPS